MANHFNYTLQISACPIRLILLPHPFRGLNFDNRPRKIWNESNYRFVIIKVECQMWETSNPGTLSSGSEGASLTVNFQTTRPIIRLRCHTPSLQELLTVWCTATHRGGAFPECPSSVSCQWPSCRWYMQRVKGDFWHPCSVQTQRHSSVPRTEISSLMPSNCCEQTVTSDRERLPTPSLTPNSETWRQPHRVQTKQLNLPWAGQVRFPLHSNGATVSTVHITLT
jgi:hypothetical protein